MKILPKRTKEPVNGKGENVIRKEQHKPRTRRKPVVAVWGIQQPVKIQQKTRQCPQKEKKNELQLTKKQPEPVKRKLPVHRTEEHIPVPLTNEQEEVVRKQSLRNFHEPVTRKQSLTQKHEVLANKQQEEQSPKRKCVMKTGKVATTPRKTTIRNEPAMKKQAKDATISKNEGGSPRKKLLARQEKRVTTPQKRVITKKSATPTKKKHEHPVISKKQQSLRKQFATRQEKKENSPQKTQIRKETAIMRQYKESELLKKQKGAMLLHINWHVLSMIIERGCSKVRYQMHPRNCDLNIPLPFPTTKAGVFHLHNRKLQLWHAPKVSDMYLTLIMINPKWLYLQPQNWQKNVYPMKYYLMYQYSPYQ